MIEKFKYSFEVKRGIFQQIKPILIALIIIVSPSCEKNGLFDAGAQISVRVDLAPFHTLEVGSIFEIELISDTTNFVIVTCGENLIEKVKAEVKDDILFLTDNNKYNWSRKYDKIKLSLHSSSLVKMNIRDPIILTTPETYKANILSIVDWSYVSEVDINIDVNSFYLSMGKSNAADFNISGKCNEAYFYGWGTCFIYADKLQAQNAYIRNRSIGDIYVWVTDKMVVSLEWAGNVYYSFDPENIIIENQISTGKLIRISP